MTEIQSDEVQETNGEDQADVRPQRAWEQFGISQHDYFEAAQLSQDNRRKLDTAENKIRMARDVLKLLMDADTGNTTDDYDLSCRAIDQLDQVQSLLKSAAKKIDKYHREQWQRDIKNWRKPRDLEHGDDRGEQQKEIIELLSGLSWDEANEAFFTYVGLFGAKRSKNEKLAEDIRTLLETQPVPWVGAFAHMAEKGLVQLTPKTDVTPE